MRDAILYNLVVIGEAVRAMTAETRSMAPAVPWTDIVGLRNLLTHRYFDVSLKRIVEISQTHLPALAATVDLLLADRHE